MALVAGLGELALELSDLGLVGADADALGLDQDRHDLLLQLVDAGRLRVRGELVVEDAVELARVVRVG